MDQKKLLSQLIEFIQNEPACVQTLSCLKPEAEIQVTIAQAYSIRVSYKDSAVQVFEEKSARPDFVFSASPDAIETLISGKGLTPSKLGVKFLKQVLAQEVKVSMPTNIFLVSKKGYLDILKVGGVEFLSELKKIGLTNIPKILSALRKLKN